MSWAPVHDELINLESCRHVLMWTKNQKCCEKWKPTSDTKKVTSRLSRLPATLFPQCIQMYGTDSAIKIAYLARYPIKFTILEQTLSSVVLILFLNVLSSVCKCEICEVFWTLPVQLLLKLELASIYLWQRPSKKTWNAMGQHRSTHCMVPWQQDQQHQMQNTRAKCRVREDNPWRHTRIRNLAGQWDQ